MARDSQHDWYHSDEEDLPQAARQPWAAVNPSVTLDPIRGVEISSAGLASFYTRQAHQADPALSAPRSEDYMEIAVQFVGDSQVSGWPSGASGHVLFLDDGERAIGVSIGPTLRLVDPSTGATHQEVQAGWGWLHPQGYRLIKVDSTAFELWVDGRLLARLPYEAAAPSAHPVATKGFGFLHAGGSGLAHWQAVDSALNVTLPPQWKVNRERVNIASALQEMWAETHRALLRAFLGTSQATQDGMTQLWERFTAGRIVTSRATLDGDKLPLDADPAWFEIVTGVASITIVRDRLRFTSGPPLISNFALAGFTLPTPTNPEEASYRVRAEITVRSFESTDPEGRLGVGLELQNGHQAIRAIMLRSRFNPRLVGWVLQNGPVTGPIGDVGETHWYVDAFQTNLVEMYVIARDRVILLVNGRLVDEQPYSNFTSTPTGAYLAGLGTTTNPATSILFDAENVLVERSYSANRYRPLFLQRLQERLIFVGGCERNDRLDVWNRNRHGVHAMRGTEIGMRNELRRVSCDDSLSLVSEPVPAEWFLEVSYPDITPIFLEAEGVIAHTIVEFRGVSPNFSPEAFRAMARKYLMPRSVIEASFNVALATELTSPSISLISTATFDVAAPAGFAAGNPVELREDLALVALNLEYVDRLLPSSSDTMLVSAFDGWIWADWTFSQTGEQGVSVDGSVALAGLDGDRVNLITPGEVVSVTSASAVVDGFVNIFGIETGTGDAIRERLLIVAGATVTGTVLWDEVHGGTLDGPAQDTVTIIDDSDSDTLYVIAAAGRASGCHLFDPGLLCGPQILSAVSDGATIESIIVHGGEALAGTITVDVPLNGVVPVATVEPWSGISVVAAGYIPAAQTLTLGAVFSDPAGRATLVSNNAADGMLARVFGVDLNGAGLLEELTLTGLVSVVGTAEFGHILGVEIAAAGLGVISVSMTGGSTPVGVGTFDSSVLRGIGIERRKIDTIGAVIASQNVASPLARPVVAFGLDPDGVYQVEAIYLDSLDEVSGLRSWGSILGLALGGIPPTRAITLAGVAWRYNGARALVVGLSPLAAWVATVPPTALDPMVDVVTDADAKAAALALAGTLSVVEATTIITIDQATGAVVTELIGGGFSIGAIMRQRITP